MPLSFNCPQCGKAYTNVRDSYAGKRMKCKCGKVMRLGGAKVDPPKEAAEPVPFRSPFEDPIDLDAEFPVVNDPVVVHPISEFPAPVAPVEVDLAQPVSEFGNDLPSPAVAPLVSGMPVVDPLFGDNPPMLPGAGDSLLGPNSGLGSSYPLDYPPPPSVPPAKKKKSTEPKVVFRQPVTWPVLSIVSASLGLIYALILALVMLSVVWQHSGQLLHSQRLTNESQMKVVMAMIFEVGILLGAVGMLSLCAVSLRNSIQELTERFRKPEPSFMAGMASALLIALFLVQLVIGFAMRISAAAPGAGQQARTLRTTGQSSFGFLIGALIVVIVLSLIPGFVLAIGLCRRKFENA